MASQYERPAEPEPVAGWAVSGIVFVGAVMILIGAFQVLAGLVAIVDDEFYVVRANYTIDIDTSAWGGIHLLLGVVILVGVSLLARRAWAGVATVIMAGISAAVTFFFIPYYPFWSLLVIALDIWVIWAITRPGAIRT